MIAVSMGLGLALRDVSLGPISRLFRAETALATLLLVVCVQLMTSGEFRSFRLIFDSSLQKEIAAKEQAMIDCIEHVQKIRGDVLCSTLVGYRAGKRLVVDDFNAGRRMSAGTLPKDAVSARVAKGTLTIVEPCGRW